MFIAVRKHNKPVFLNVNEIKIIRDAEPDIHNPDYDPKVHPGSVIFTTTDQHSTLERYFSTMSPEDLRDVINDAAAQVYTAPIAARIMSLDNCVARLARSMEDWLELANTPIINCDGMTPEEAERFKASMRETRATLDSIQPRLVAGGSPGKPQHFVGLDSDVFNVVQLLTSHEWADHCTSTQLGQRLESAVTDLHNQHSKTREELEKALGFLSWVRHEYQQSGQIGVFHFSEMEKIAEFLRDRENKTCEKE